MTAIDTRIIGIGQPAAGDDQAGIAVARVLRAGTLPASVAVHEITDTAWLVELLDGIHRAVLIDAVVADGDPGNILNLTPGELAAFPSTPLSSHGMSVSGALRLLPVLSPDRAACDIRIIGICIDAPTRYTHALSPAVAAAVPRAAAMIMDLLEGQGTMIHQSRSTG